MARRKSGMPDEAEFLDHVRIEDAHMLGKQPAAGFSTRRPPKYCCQCTDASGPLNPLKMRQLVKAFEDGVLTKRDDFVFPKKAVEKYSDEPDEVPDPVLYPENEDEKMYPSEDMPIVFHRVWKNISMAKLPELKSNDSWMGLDVWLCDACFFRYAETAKPFRRAARQRETSDDEEEADTTPDHKAGDDGQRVYKSVLKGSKTTLLTASRAEPSRATDEMVGGPKSRLAASHSVSQMQKLGQLVGLPRDRLVQRPLLGPIDLRYPVGIGSRYTPHDKKSEDSRAETKAESQTTPRVAEYVRTMHKSAVSEVLLPRLQLPTKAKKPATDSSVFGSTHSRQRSTATRKVDYGGCLEVLRETEKYRRLFES